MQKTDGKIHYPKRREKLDINKMVFGVPEPQRKSLYRHIVENLQLVKRKTFLHRIIYMGEYDSKVMEKLEDILGGTVKACNEGYCIEKLTGFLVYYTKHFVHLVEGDEDSIFKHIQMFLHHPSYNEMIKTVKFVTFISDIQKRLSEEWFFYVGVPPKLMGTLNANCSIQEAGRQVYLCIRKLYNLINQIIHDVHLISGSNTITSISESIHRAESIVSSTVTSKNLTKSILSIVTKDKSLLKDPYRVNLPEVDVLDFIIKLPCCPTLSKFNELYGVVPQVQLYGDNLWPVPSDYVPYDVFSKPYEMITELPKAKKSTMTEKFERLESLTPVSTISLAEKSSDEWEKDEKQKETTEKSEN